LVQGVSSGFSAQANISAVHTTSNSLGILGQNRTKKKSTTRCSPQNLFTGSNINGLTEFTVLLSICPGELGLVHQWWVSGFSGDPAIHCSLASRHVFWDVLGILQGERGPHGRGYS